MAISGQAATDWTNNMRAYLKAQFAARLVSKRQADFNANPPMIPDPIPEDMNHKRAMQWSEVSSQIETEAKAQAEPLVDMILDDLITNLLGFIVNSGEITGVRIGVGVGVVVDPVLHTGATTAEGAQTGIGRIQ